MLGDIQISEPKALIGFAGQRVIENTIREKLTEGFQRAEYLLEHGMIDMVVHRKDLSATLARLIAYLAPEKAAGPSDPSPPEGEGLSKALSPCPTTPIPATPPSRPSSTALPRCRRAATSLASTASPNSAPASATRRTTSRAPSRSEEHTSELQSLMRISYAVFCLQHNNTTDN